MPNEFERRVHQVVVRISPPDIVIEQGDDEGEREAIFLSPDQVPILIEWLEAAVDELRKPAPADAGKAEETG